MTFSEVIIKRMEGLIETGSKDSAWEMEAVAEMTKAVHLLRTGFAQAAPLDEDHPDCVTDREHELYDALMGLSSAITARQGWSKWVQGGVQIAPIVHKALRLHASPEPSTHHRQPSCECGFAVDVCKTNHCHRKQIASAGLSPVPAGYSKLPDGVVCKCFKMWRASDGSHWCCLPSPGSSKVRGSDV